MKSVRRYALSALAALVAGVVLVPGAQAQAGPTVPKLDWKACDPGFECASAAVPLDYADPAAVYDVALAASPRRPQPPARLAVHQPRRTGGLGRRLRASVPAASCRRPQRPFDIVGFDPRGTGAGGPLHWTSRASRPRQVPLRVGPPSRTGHSGSRRATDQDRRRPGSAAGDQTIRCCLRHDRRRRAGPWTCCAGGRRPKFYYLGFSYGTFLGATYASCSRAAGPRRARRPRRRRRLHQPPARPCRTTGGFERELGRFFQACAPTRLTAWASAATTRTPRSTGWSRRQREADPSARLHGRPAPDHRRRPPQRDVGEVYAKQLWGAPAWRERRSRRRLPIRYQSDARSGA